MKQLKLLLICIFNKRRNKKVTLTFADFNRKCFQFEIICFLSSKKILETF